MPVVALSGIFYVLCAGHEAGMIGLEAILYSVKEDDGEVEVCVNTSSSSSCPFPFSFNVTLSTKDDTAGTYIVFWWCCQVMTDVFLQLLAWIMRVYPQS